jgi:hypothetical protein
MAIDIVKLENGNVAFYDDGTGDFIKSLSADVVEIECNPNGSVKIMQDNNSVEYLYPANVNSTQVLPAAAIPFTGTCADLAELLSTDFFFEVGGGGLDGIYPSGAWVNFLPNYAAPSTFTASANLIGGVVTYIKTEVSFNLVRASVTTPVAAGNTGVIGIYRYTSGNNFELVSQANGTLDLSVAAVQQLAFASGITLTEGVYAFVTHLSAATPMQHIIAAATQNVFGFPQTMVTASHSAFFVHSAAYTGILPATITVATLNPGGTAYPHLLFKIS